MAETPTQEVDRVIGSLNISINEARELTKKRKPVPQTKQREFDSEATNAKRFYEKHRDDADIDQDIRDTLRDRILAFNTVNSILKSFIPSGWAEGEIDESDSKIDSSGAKLDPPGAAAAPDPAPDGLRRLVKGRLPLGMVERHAAFDAAAAAGASALAPGRGRRGRDRDGDRDGGRPGDGHGYGDGAGDGRRGRGGRGATQRKRPFDGRPPNQESDKRPQETIAEKITSINDGIQSIERLRYIADFSPIWHTVLGPHNPGGINEIDGRARHDWPKAFNDYVDVGVQQIDEDTNMVGRTEFCLQMKDILSYGLGELREPEGLENIRKKIQTAKEESTKITLLEKQLPDDIVENMLAAIDNVPDEYKAISDAVKLIIDDPSEKNFDKAMKLFETLVVDRDNLEMGYLYQLIGTAKELSVTKDNLETFKGLSDDIEITANRVQTIERAIVSTSDTRDYADAYDFYSTIENLYEQQFEIDSLVSDISYLLSEKIQAPPTRGGAVSKTKMREIATTEKSSKLREDASLKLRDLQLKSDKIGRKISSWNARLASGVLNYQGRVEADKELKGLYKEVEDGIKGLEDIQKELEGSKVDRWFETLEEKTSNYVEFANSLQEARKKRIEAEIKQKEATAKFATANAIKRLIENCLKDLKDVSTKKCDRINSLRELYRTAKEIEAAKTKLVEKAQLMIDPSRGTAQFSDELTDGQRLKRFEDLKKVLTQESQSFVMNNLKADRTPINNNVKFRSNFNQYAVILKQVADSAAFYGTNPNSKTNEDLAELRRNVEEYQKKANEIPTSPNIIPIDILLSTHFKRSTELALKILDNQPVLLNLTKRGGELIVQEIDANKRQLDQATEKLMLDYEELKSLPTQIQKSDQLAKICFNEGFGASKKEKEAALKEELESIKSGKDAQMKKIEEEHGSSIAIIKNDVVKHEQLRKELKDMSPEELDKKYENILNEVQILEGKVRENKPEDAEKIPRFKERVELLRAKLSEIGKLRKPAAVGGRRVTRRIIH